MKFLSGCTNGGLSSSAQLQELVIKPALRPALKKVKMNIKT
jgi:hypothetical protein